jgi:DNA repair protein RAD5
MLTTRRRIHTNTASSHPDLEVVEEDPSSDEAEVIAVFSEDSDDEKVYVPSPVKTSKAKRPVHTQAKLGSEGKVVSRRKGKGKQPSGPTATLVVAPMTLLSQWCDELERSSNGQLSVLMYYGSDRTNIQEEIASGVDVVVTR